jgi:Domain of unknown function (DUF4926)
MGQDFILRLVLNRPVPTSEKLTIRLRQPMAEIQMLSVVALLEDMPEKGLLRGQVGTVVAILAPGVFEAEFSDDAGRTYAAVALCTDQMMRLHHEPSHQAA